MCLNYPNNPTGAIAELDTFEEAVAYCRKYEILLAHDAPYCDITFDGFKAPSVLQVSGAKDVAVEFNSLSKTYNMAGWRLGFLVGNKDVVNIVHTYKSQVDTSTFIPLMVAAATALKGNQSWLEERNLIYQNRRDITIEALQNMGLEVVKPKAAFYLWVKIPANFLNASTFCNQMLRETGVSTTPGSNFGSNGDGYFRISLSQDTQLIAIAMQKMHDWLRSL